MIYCSCTFCVPAQNVIPLSHGFELASVSHPELPSCAKVPTWKVTPTTSTETSKERSTQKQWTGWMTKMEEKPKLQEPLKFGIEKILYGSSNPESFGEHLSVLDSPPNCSKKRYQSLPWSRPVFTSDQRTTLEHHFQLQHYLTKRERFFLSLHLGLTEHQIKIWFQNRRVKHRNAVKEEKQRTRNTGVGGGVTSSPREQHE